MPTVNFWARAVAAVGVAVVVAQREDENSRSWMMERPPDLCCGSVVAPREGAASTAFVTASPVVASLDREQWNRRYEERKTSENRRLQAPPRANLQQRGLGRGQHSQRISNPWPRGGGQQLVKNSRHYPPDRAETRTMNRMVEAEAPQESETPQSRRVMMGSQEAYNAARNQQHVSMIDVNPEATSDDLPHEKRFPSSTREIRFPRPSPDLHFRNNYETTAGASQAARTHSASGRSDQDYGDRPPVASTRPLGEPSNSQSIEHNAHLRSDSRHSISNYNAAEPSNRQTEPRRPQHQTAESDDIGDDLRWQRVNKPSTCCGSNIPFDPLRAQATGVFSREEGAGSIKVIDVPAEHSYPPADVRDLQVVPFDAHTLGLTWTAPGEDLDFGTASGYIIRLTEAKDDLLDSQFDMAPAETLLETKNALAAAGVYQTAGTRVGVKVPLARGLQRGRVYYLALKAVDKLGNASGVSNVVHFFLPGLLTRQETTSQRAINENTTKASSYPQGLPRENKSRTAERERLLVSLPTTTTLTPPAAPGASRELEALSTELGTGGDTHQPNSSTPPPEPDSNQAKERNRKRRRNRQRKNRKKNKRAKKGRCGKANRRRRGRQREETDMSDPARCVMTPQEKTEQVTLCDARYSLELVIAYFTQNHDYQHLDYLQTALLTLQQKEQPPRRTEDNTRGLSHS